jgi:hypothetical protein
MRLNVLWRVAVSMLNLIPTFQRNSPSPSSGWKNDSAAWSYCVKYTGDISKGDVLIVRKIRNAMLLISLFCFSWRRAVIMKFFNCSFYERLRFLEVVR